MKRCRQCPYRKNCRDVCYGDTPCDFARAFDSLDRKLKWWQAKAKAADAAAKRCPHAHFAVGSVYHLPVADKCCDMLMTIFAPYCGEEYHRVLHKGGTMMMVIPGQQHLWGLKEAIYDVPYPNAVRDYALDGFELIQAEYVDSWLKLDNPADIQNLFQMTPYYYKTGREEHARLEQLESLSTQISFEILQYRAVAETGEK